MVGGGDGNNPMMDGSRMHSPLNRSAKRRGGGWQWLHTAARSSGVQLGRGRGSAREAPRRIAAGMFGFDESDVSSSEGGNRGLAVRLPSSRGAGKPGPAGDVNSLLALGGWGLRARMATGPPSRRAVSPSAAWRRWDRPLVRTRQDRRSTMRRAATYLPGVTLAGVALLAASTGAIG